MKLSKIIGSIFVMLVLCIGACSAITISGSTTALPLVETLAETAPVTTTVTGGGSGVGITNVQNGISDIGMVSRSLKPEETGLIATPIAFDGIVIVTSKEVGLSAITIDQLKGIYNGTITNWAELGGPDAEIYAISREMGSGTQDTFNTDVMGDKAAELVGSSTVASSNSEVVQAVRGSDSAIGFVGFNFANPSNINVLSLDSVMPTAETIKDKSYKLSRELSLVTPENQISADVDQFIAYALSAEGQSITSEMGYIPL